MRSSRRRCTEQELERRAELVRHYVETGEALPGVWEALLRTFKDKRSHLGRGFPHPEAAFYVACCRTVRWLRRPSTVEKLAHAQPRHVTYCVRCALAGEYSRIKKMILARWTREFKRPKLTRRQWLERRIERAEDHPASQEFLRNVSDIQGA